MRKNEIIKFLLAVILAAMPMSVSAAVLINEIAWMGTAISPQDEWLELKNDGGENVDLTGWILTIENVKDIALDKSIVAGGYYLIERTDDNTVPNITADLISPFGNGLNNGGATLILKNSAGNEMDRIVSGENWSIGGDNATKNTAQRTPSSWFTAAPTPRAANANSSSNNPPAGEQNTGSPSQSSSVSQTSSTASAEKPPEIKVEIAANRTIVSGADALFAGKALDGDGQPLDKVRFMWNFGDGETKEGQNVLHRFRFPGEYIVILDIAYGKWSAAARLTATAIKSPLIISRVEESASGFVELTNEGIAELDLFGWYLKSNNVSFLIPKNTIIVGGKKIIFPNEVTKLVAGSVLLLYPNGVVAANYEKPTPPATPAIVPVKESPDAPKPTSSPNSELGKTQVKFVEEAKSTVESQVRPVKEEVAAVYEATPKNSRLGVWLLALGGLIVISIGALLFSKQKPTATNQQSEASEYKIVE